MSTSDSLEILLKFDTAVKDSGFRTPRTNLGRSTHDPSLHRDPQTRGINEGAAVLLRTSTVAQAPSLFTHETRLDEVSFTVEKAIPACLSDIYYAVGTVTADNRSTSWNSGLVTGHGNLFSAIAVNLERFHEYHGDSQVGGATRQRLDELISGPLIDDEDGPLANWDADTIGTIVSEVQMKIYNRLYDQHKSKGSSAHLSDLSTTPLGYLCADLSTMVKSDWQDVQLELDFDSGYVAFKLNLPVAGEIRSSFYNVKSQAIRAGSEVPVVPEVQAEANPNFPYPLKLEF
jgi:hypothetical protein